MARRVTKGNEGQPLDASARLRLPYARMLIPEADGGYRAEILEFPGCIAEGDDAAEALSELEAVAEDWIDAATEMGSPIPPPLDETNFSGKLNLRLPKSLHRKASLVADLDGVSLNQLIVASLAQYLGQKSAEAESSNVMVVGAGMPGVHMVYGAGLAGVHMVSGLHGVPLLAKATSFDAQCTLPTLVGFESRTTDLQEPQYADS